MAESWHYAIEEFKKSHPDVEVLFELKTFEDTQATARMVLNSDEAPDIMQTNKGNATAGLYSKEGLLTNLEAVAKERGWDKAMSPSIQSTCRYNEEGLMGSGDLWGITTYGEFVMVYYNKDMFAKYGLDVPTSLEEFEKICDTFVANGIIPIGLGGASQWPATHNWFEFVLYEADRDLADPRCLRKVFLRHQLLHSIRSEVVHLGKSFILILRMSHNSNRYACLHESGFFNQFLTVCSLTFICPASQAVF